MKPLRTAVLGPLALALTATAAVAVDVTFLRIGTGGVAGTYYPIGALVAAIISNPPGSRPCERGGSCGVPGLIAVAQASDGSVANVEAIQSGALETGFAQSDVAYWAYSGEGIFADSPPADKLRVIASLYPETVHLVARRGADIATVTDLAGRRVSLDEPGSGTLVVARLVLDAHGLGEDDVEAFYLKPSSAIPLLRAGELDAFIIVAGHPTPSVSELADGALVTLIPLDGPAAAAVAAANPFLSPAVIPAGVYDGVDATPTLSVGAQWLASADLDPELVYGITRSLWLDGARKVLDEGHPKGRDITLESALDGVAVPLHEGAEQYYREVGVLDQEGGVASREQAQR